MGNLIGAAIGFIIPTLFVNANASNLDIQSQFVSMLVLQLLLGFLAMMLTIFLFKESPPTPASPIDNIGIDFC